MCANPVISRVPQYWRFMKRQTAIPFDDYNSRILAESHIVGGVTTQWGNPAPRHGWKVIECYEETDKGTAPRSGGEELPD